MKIVIKTKNLKLTRALENFIEEKINDLEKFLPPTIFGGGQSEKYFDSFYGKGKPRAEAWVEIGKETRHHKKGPYFWAECQMRFPKRSLRSIARAEDLKLAITEVKDELQRESKQYKEKFRAETKRGARVLKKELKLSPLARFYRKGRIREEGV
jgi:ribosome-associated translation inhibitor RaiA